MASSNQWNRIAAELGEDAERGAVGVLPSQDDRPNSGLREGDITQTHLPVLPLAVTPQSSLIPAYQVPSFG